MDLFKSKRQRDNEDLQAAGAYLLGLGLVSGACALWAWAATSEPAPVKVDYQARREAERALRAQERAERELRQERLARLRAELAVDDAKLEAERARLRSWKF